MRHIGLILVAIALAGCIPPFAEPLPAPVVSADQAIKIAILQCDDDRAYNRELWNATLKDGIWHVTYDGEGEAMRSNNVVGHRAVIRAADGAVLKCDPVHYP